MAGKLATTLAALGGIVCVDGKGDEIIISSIADGTALAGWVVGVVLSTGKVQGTDDGAFEYFTGILLARYDTDPGTAPTSGDAVEIVLPKTGRRYNVAIADPSADKEAGLGYVFSSTVGNLTLQADIVVLNLCRLSKPIANTSRFAEMIWGM